MHEVHANPLSPLLFCFLLHKDNVISEQEQSESSSRMTWMRLSKRKSSAVAISAAGSVFSHSLPGMPKPANQRPLLLCALSRVRKSRELPFALTERTRAMTYKFVTKYEKKQCILPRDIIMITSCHRATKKSCTPLHAPPSKRSHIQNRNCREGPDHLLRPTSPDSSNRDRKGSREGARKFAHDFLNYCVIRCLSHPKS